MSALTKAFADALNGGVGGAVATAIAYPLVIAKVKLQAQDRQTGKSQRKRDHDDGGKGGSDCPGIATPSFAGPIDVLRKVLAHEGVAGWYRGLPAAILKNFLTNFLFYLAHSVVKPMYKAGDKYTTWFGAFLHGVNAGLIVQLIMLPMEMIVTRMQTQQLGATLSFAESARGIAREGGLLHFWAGLPPALTLTLNPGVTTTVQAALTGGRQLSATANFWVGFFSKLVASFTTYPVVVVKVRMLVQGAAGSDRDGGDGGASAALDRNKSQLQRAIAIFKGILKTNGVPGLYLGLQAQLWQAVAKEAILNSVRRGLGST